MKQKKSGMALSSSGSRLLLTALFVSFFIYSVKVNASGAKLPEVKESTIENTLESTVPNVADSSATTVTTEKPITVQNNISDTQISGGHYSYLDPDHEVPSELLNKALTYYDNNLTKIKNKEVLGVIDFKQHNSKERFYIIDMVSGKVDKYLVAHGKNSDPDFDGYATLFSNTINSEMSSQGFYLTAETYEGSHGHSLALDGLSSTNSNARKRSIVIHPADYVYPGSKIGRSWGCPALDPRYSYEIIERIKNGALIYAE